MGKDKKIKLWALVMLIFVPTFGFGNIASNAVYLGPAAIPSWVIVAILYFLPLCGIIAEMASANQDKEGGIYSWINKAIGEKWAFIGTWTYFIGILFYLQMVFSRIPVAASWAILGRNIFTDSNSYLLPILSIFICIIMTYIATIGVSKFSKLADFGGKFTLAATVIFIVMAIVGYFVGTPSATDFTPSNVIPDFNVNYFSTFSWLLFAVSGSEVAGTYIMQTDKPKKTFPKAMMIATLLIALSYILGSVAIQLIASPKVLQDAGLQDAGYVVYSILANNFGIDGKIVVQIYAAINLITSIAAYIIWMESPIRAMFGEVPKGTFPEFLTKKRKDGTLVNALWTQCAILVVLIAIPLVGIGSVNDFFKLLTDLSSLAVVVPYVILIYGYIIFRKNNKNLEFKFFKSNILAYSFAGIALVLSCAGFFGAGLDYIVGSSGKEAVMLIIKTYGGPVILTLLGLFITNFSKKAYNRKIKKQFEFDESMGEELDLN
ncbi:amino acid permease [Clostridium sp. Ade.TY]|uniref:amino acid permease n=1 Tax=Clostridium sp. Ade.TY TaxID=1391647 RepID=UPI0004106BBC|nr:amino acid permease [Clostridium sp. Ade.TY]